MDRIQQLVNEPKKTTASDIALLKAKVEQYPYVQTYQLLYLISLYKNNDDAFNTELESRSVYFNDPNFIENYFQEPKQEEKVEEVSTTLSEDPANSEEVAFTTENEVLDEPGEENKDTIQVEIVEEQLEKETPVETIATSDSYIENMKKLGLEHLIPADYIPSSEIVPTENVNKLAPTTEETEIVPESNEDEVFIEVNPDEIEEQIKEELISEKEETTEDDINSNTTEKEEIEPEAVVFEIENEVEFEEEVQAESIIENIEEVEESSNENEGKVALEEKSKIENSNALIEEVEESPVEKEEIVEDIQGVEEEVSTIDEVGIENSVVFKNKRTFSQWANLSRAKPKNSLGEERKSAIINKFLESSPSISPVKQNVESDAIDFNALMEDEQEISHLMTETLAQLYVDQKKYSKAIQAYEILSLKNPEKSSIFADLIKELKNKK